MASSLAAYSITASLGTSIVAHDVVCFAQLPSTMNEARRRAAAGAAEGLVVLAEEQTAGRGRGGRPWLAPPGSALLLSLLLRPRWLAPERAFALTMLAATSLCAAVEATTGLRPALKWPNDVLLAQAKAAGILAELHIHAGALDWAVIGIGVNVHAHPPPDQTRYPAISLDAALGSTVDRPALLRALLRQLDAGYSALRADGYDTLFAAWRARLATLGQAVRVATPAGLLEGRAVDVTPTGALLLRGADGLLRTVTTGDVQA